MKSCERVVWRISEPSKLISPNISNVPNRLQLVFSVQKRIQSCSSKMVCFCEIPLHSGGSFARSGHVGIQLGVQTELRLRHVLVQVSVQLVFGNFAAAPTATSPSAAASPERPATSTSTPTDARTSKAAAFVWRETARHSPPATTTWDKKGNRCAIDNATDTWLRATPNLSLPRDWVFKRLKLLFAAARPLVPRRPPAKSKRKTH